MKRQTRKEIKGKTPKSAAESMLSYVQTFQKYIHVWYLYLFPQDKALVQITTIKLSSLCICKTYHGGYRDLWIYSNVYITHFHLMMIAVISERGCVIVNKAIGGNFYVTFDSAKVDATFQCEIKSNFLI